MADTHFGYQKIFQRNDLIVALDSLKEFCEGRQDLEFSDFESLYEQTRKCLIVFAEEENNQYIKQKLREFPEFFKSEFGKFEEYVWKEIPAIILMCISPLFQLFYVIFNFRRGNRLKDKLLEVAFLCDHIRFVLDNPGSEKLLVAK